MNRITTQFLSIGSSGVLFLPAGHRFCEAYLQPPYETQQWRTNPDGTNGHNAVWTNPTLETVIGPATHQVVLVFMENTEDITPGEPRSFYWMRQGSIDIDFYDLNLNPKQYDPRVVGVFYDSQCPNVLVEISPYPWVNDCVRGKSVYAPKRTRKFREAVDVG